MWCETIFQKAHHEAITIFHARRLLLVFSSEREMLESRGRLMIRQLCGHLDPRRLYVTVARAIQQERLVPGNAGARPVVEQCYVSVSYPLVM